MNKEIDPPVRRVKATKSNPALPRRTTPYRDRGERASSRAHVTEPRTGRPGQFENVSQELMSPLFKPAVSHFCRCAEEPWVKLSGTA
jgi:hypothetical protein